ncbi:MAG: sigma-70 family RNA polymerase sigma factor [Armatimonadetes bacterium]|nr:sigma-70 family RNA polymerase sigma factor [Armatimonadota bacterium]
MSVQQIALNANTSTPALQQEFESLIANTKRKAYNMAYRMTGNRDDAEDLLQEAYLRAYRSFQTYHRDMPFESWFYRILSNLFIDGLRRRPRQKVVSLDQPVSETNEEDGVALDIPDPTPNPEESFLTTHMAEPLENALASLPEDFRLAVLFCDVDQMSYEEIANAMGTSIGTVRSRIHRGRQMLRRLLTANNGDHIRTTPRPRALQHNTKMNKPSTIHHIGG